MAPVKRKTESASFDVSIKKKQKIDAAPQRLVQKEETPFPRGGGSVLTPLEQRQIQIQAKNDVLFEQRTGLKASRKDFEGNESACEEGGIEKTPSKPKKRKQTSKDLIAETGGPSVRIESLSYKVSSLN